MDDQRSQKFFTWPNLVCLDAPLVAIAWQWLFARSFGIPIVRGGTAALFLTAWLIYLADRFGDSLAVDARGPVSLRQRFCLRHRRAWLVAIGVIAVADLFVISTRVEWRTVLAGAAVGACAVGYLVVNQRWPRLWRWLPLKEVSIGLLFAAGTIVGLNRGLTSEAWVAWLLFACLCWLNCVSIAVWESDLDAAQQRTSIATAFPDVGRSLLPALVLLVTLCSALGFAGPGTRVVSSCIAASALLLVMLHVFRSRIAADARTALADLVLLTPIVLLIASAL